MEGEAPVGGAAPATAAAAAPAPAAAAAPAPAPAPYDFTPIFARVGREEAEAHLPDAISAVTRTMEALFSNNETTKVGRRAQQRPRTLLRNSTTHTTVLCSVAVHHTSHTSHT